MKNFSKTKFIKYLLIISTNVFLFVCLWFLFDLFFYSYSLKKANILNISNLLKMYKTEFIYYHDSEDFFSGKEDNKGRAPDRTEYKNSEPIVVFGCSFAYGHRLNASQTFSRKLSEKLKRTVYNRAYCGAGFQHAYKQSLSDNFYKTVPPSKTVIYILIEDHFRRICGETFFLYDNYLNIHYKYKNGRFIEDNYNNFIYRFLKSSYLLKYIRFNLKFQNFLNPKNFDEISDEALAYLVQTRNNLEQHWNNKINFIVLVYDKGDITDCLIPKLQICSKG